MTRRILALFTVIICISLNINAQELKLLDAKDAVTGAMRTEKFLPMLENKRVGVVANQTSIMVHCFFLIK